ncbi:MAG: hypothetical protein ABEH43_06365 [Flavobacteriales bacterium]
MPFKKLENKLGGLSRFNKIWIGVVIGIIGECIGLFLVIVLLGLFKTGINVVNLISDAPSISAPFLALALIFNVPLVHISLNKDLDKLGKGILSTFFLFGLLIIYFKFFHG